ncbi:MAG: hypothetical protein ACYTGL_01260 [Planctomycetota bacterium]|jgi:hypothetical protein
MRGPGVAWQNRVTRLTALLLTLAACVYGGRSLEAAEPGLENPAPGQQFPPLHVEMLRKGDSSRDSLAEAIDRLPAAQLTEEQISRIRGVLEKRSLFRQLPTLAVEATPEVHSYFVSNPEAAVGIWRVLKISQFELQKTQPTVWFGDAGDGSQGTIEVLHRSPNSVLLHCDGAYKSPLLPKPIRATSIMHLRVQPKKMEDGTSILVQDLDLFVTFPSQTVDTVARLISPVSHMIADRNFRELTLFVRFMQVAMERQPGWVERTVQRIEGIDRKQREELLTVSARAFVDSRKRQLSGEGIQQAGLEEILAPYQQTPTVRAQQAGM